MSDPRNRRKVLNGVVTSDKMDKTITVSVERIFKHLKYKKYIRRNESLKAHDENGEAHIGDHVEVMECRPISKNKCWRLVKVTARATISSGGPA